MRNGTPQISSLKRTLATLDAVLIGGADRPVTKIARDLGIPPATAHRQIATLAAEGYLARTDGGRYVAGPRLLRLLHHLDERQAIASAASPVLHRLAAEAGAVVQLGTFENDMVTYRIKTGEGAGGLFTKVGMQLEAYCSGIGKALLAHLPERELEAYLAAGSFPPLTPRTIVSADALRTELARVRANGHAIDDEEIMENLFCVAMPIVMADGRAPAAISITRIGAEAARAALPETVVLLRGAVRDILNTSRENGADRGR